MSGCEGAAAVESCVTELNALDKKNDNFIKTIEAEDLHAAAFPELDLEDS
jgi:hypothetical protein